MLHIIIKNNIKFASVVTIVLGFLGLVSTAYGDPLSCTVATSCPTGTVIYKMSDTSNAHAELASGSSYSQLVCCTGVTGLGNSCSGNYAVAVRLAKTTNAHIEQNDQGNYTNEACISAPSGATISVGYQDTNCTGYDTTLGSMSKITNSQAGDGSAYTKKICATVQNQTLTFSISDNTIGFGSLLAASARYATGDASGAGTDTADAHTISASTNATGGYTVTLNGTTLTCAGCGGATITPIGASAAASSAGSEQFGTRLIVNSGTGSASAPYNTANWALDTASFPDVVATGSGDNTTTTYGVRYIANIAPSTDAGSYSSVLTYTATAAF